MIRKAKKHDINEIYSLYRDYSLNVEKIHEPEYATTVQQDGFLVALEDKNDIEKRIESNFLFHVYEENGKILGYININKEIYFPEDADNIIWFDKALKQMYFHSKTAIVLHEIIVARNQHEKGIATQLLEQSKQAVVDAGYTDIFSIVTLAPVTNCPSLIFHTKNVFERACVTMPIELFGMKNYMSVLFHLPINDTFH